MSVLIAIGFDEAPVVVAAYDVGLQAWHDSYIQLACVVVKGNRNRLWCGFKPLQYWDFERDAVRDGEGATCE